MAGTSDSTPSLPLLITGITGVAGFNALRYFRERYPGQVFGIRPRQTWRLVGDGIIPLNAEDGPGVKDLFQTYRFRSVLNCTGNCALKSCELDPKMARQLNVKSAAVIVENVLAHDCRLVHLSSDLVFSGKGRGNYVEDDPVDPVTMYGMSMVEGEDLVMAALPHAAILPHFSAHGAELQLSCRRDRLD